MRFHSTWPCAVLLASLCLWCGCVRQETEQSSAAPAADSDTAAATAALPAEGRIARTESQVEAISQLYDIDRIYKSMTGPWGKQEVSVAEGDTPELVWITGAHVEMIDRDGQEKMPELFMCHANLDINVEKHHALFACSPSHDGRLFTLSQGQLDVNFPAGFGIPVLSNEALDLVTQVLNLNYKDRQFQVRHRVKLDFVRDRDATTPMKPLYQGGVYGLKALAEHEVAYDVTEGMLAGERKCSSCCLPGKKAVDTAEGIDRFGRKFTGHWVVKPGREVNHTRATTMFDLSEDTTIHYIAVHMHPFAESLELRDMTTDETLFKSMVQNFDDQIGLARVDSFSSEAGLPIYADHEYEVVSTYNNTSDEDQDSMAVMYVYLLDHDFKRPELGPVAQR